MEDLLLAEYLTWSSSEPETSRSAPIIHQYGFLHCFVSVYLREDLFVGDGMVYSSKYWKQGLVRDISQNRSKITLAHIPLEQTLRPNSSLSNSYSPQWRYFYWCVSSWQKLLLIQTLSDAVIFSLSIHKMRELPSYKKTHHLGDAHSRRICPCPCPPKVCGKSLWCWPTSGVHSTHRRSWPRTHSSLLFHSQHFQWAVARRVKSVRTPNGSYNCAYNLDTQKIPINSPLCFNLVHLLRWWRRYEGRQGTSQGKSIEWR